MKKFTLGCFCLVCSCLGLRAQTISAVVADSASGKPLAGALVFLDGTTVSTRTDAGGAFALSIDKPVNARLLIRQDGYLTRTFSYPFDRVKDTLLLEAGSYTLNEPISVETEIFTRAEKLTAFRQQFLGTSRAAKVCEILNENDITLVYDPSDHSLRAYCTKPIVVRNNYTGYEIQYHLEDCRIFFRPVSEAGQSVDQSLALSRSAINDKTTSYGKGSHSMHDELLGRRVIRGTCFFKDLGPTNDAFLKRRVEMYQHSEARFFNDLAHNRIDKSGKNSDFRVIDNYRKAIDPRLLISLADGPNGLIQGTIKPNPDTEDAVREAGGRDVYSALNISYRGQATTLMLFADPTFTLDDYGNTGPDDEIAPVGDLANRRLGDLLPRDYDSGEHTTLAIEPLQEEPLKVEKEKPAAPVIAPLAIAPPQDRNLAQNVLRGIVLGDTNREPIEGAVVFLDGTGTYAVTDQTGSFALPVGEPVLTPLAVTHTDYETRTFDYPYNALPDTLLMQQKVGRNTSGIETDDPFRRSTKLLVFRRFFLGNTRSGKSCKIINEDAIELVYNKGQRCLYAYCDQPILIRNEYTGYEIRCFLESYQLFFRSPNSLSYAVGFSPGTNQATANVQAKTHSLTPELVANQKITGTFLFTALSPDHKSYPGHRSAVFQNYDRRFFYDLCLERIGAQGPDRSPFSVLDPQYRTTIDIRPIVQVADAQGMKFLTIQPARNTEDVPGHPTGKTHNALLVSYRGASSSTVLFASPGLLVDRHGNPDPMANVYYIGDFSNRGIGNLLPRDYTPEE